MLLRLITMPPITHSKNLVAIIGAGPAGLMAAEVLSQKGIRADIYEAMPSVGRKFLMAGKGGMNITHAEATVDGNKKAMLSFAIDVNDIEHLTRVIKSIEEINGVLQVKRVKTG